MEQMKVYSESTLKQWTKDKLIEYIQILTEKYNSMAQTEQKTSGVVIETNAPTSAGIKQVRKMISYCRHTGMGKNKSLDMLEKVACKYASDNESDDVLVDFNAESMEG